MGTDRMDGRTKRDPNHKCPEVSFVNLAPGRREDRARHHRHCGARLTAASDPSRSRARERLQALVDRAASARGGVIAAVISAADRIRAGCTRVWSWITWPVIAVTVVLMLAIVWGTGIEPRLTDEVQVLAVLPGLPAEWSGTRVALVADLQIGIWLANTDTVRRIVTRVVEEQPAAILIGGDLLYDPTDESGEPRQARAALEPEDRRTFQRQFGEAVALLQPLADAGIRTIAVLGNHDYAMRVPTALVLPVVADDLAQALRDAAVIVLRTEAVPLGDRDAHSRSPPTDFEPGFGAAGNRLL